MTRDTKPVSARKSPSPLGVLHVSLRSPYTLPASIFLSSAHPDFAATQRSVLHKQPSTTTSEYYIPNRTRLQQKQLIGSQNGTEAHAKLLHTRTQLPQHATNRNQLTFSPNPRRPLVSTRSAHPPSPSSRTRTPKEKNLNPGFHTSHVPAGRGSSDCARDCLCCSHCSFHIRVSCAACLDFDCSHEKVLG